MGWNPFKSKKVVTVSTAVSRIISDSMIPDSRKTGTIKGILSGDQLVENIMEEMVNSIGIKAERMYEYGKKSYVHGVPSSTLLCDASGRDVVPLVLEGIEGRPVTIDYIHYGPLNNLHYGWQTLVQSHDYNPVTNTLGILSSEKGAPVYLSDIQVVVVEATMVEQVNGSLAQWGTSATAKYSPDRPATVETATPFGVDATATQDYFRVTYAWKIGSVVHTGKFTFLMSSLDADLGYFQAKYSYGDVVGGTGTTKYWTYDDGAGIWPELDAVYTTTNSPLGTFFPIGYFRYNKAPTAANPTSIKLMKYLGIDFADAAEAINTNPDIDDVESASLMLAVPAGTSNEIEQRYLYDFFKSVYVRAGTYNLPRSEQSADIAAAVTGTPSSQVSLVIQDGLSKVSLSMSGIYRYSKVGNIGPVGTNDSGYATRTREVQGTRYESEEDFTGTPYTYTEATPSHFYRRQISSTVYQEIAVFDLTVKYFVWGKYSTTVTETSPNLLIPLDHAITQHYSAMDRETLYARSLHYVFNSKVVTKVKWYQQEWFQIFVTIVAIVITVWSMGGLSGVAAAITAATASATALLMVVIQYILFTVAIKLFVKALGPELALAIAVIAAAYGVYSAMNTGGLAGAPWAQSLLKVSSGLTSAIQDTFTEAMLDLQKQSDMFGLYTQEQTKLLEETNKLLEGNNLLSPFMVFGEAPTDYFNRTVHVGNVGMLGVEAISSYVDVALRLPTLSDTLQGNAV